MDFECGVSDDEFMRVVDAVEHDIILTDLESCIPADLFDTDSSFAEFVELTGAVEATDVETTSNEPVVEDTGIAPQEVVNLCSPKREPVVLEPPMAPKRKKATKRYRDPFWQTVSYDKMSRDDLWDVYMTRFQPKSQKRYFDREYMIAALMEADVKEILDL
jgi:hypothetical protein